MGFWVCGLCFGLGLVLFVWVWFECGFGWVGGWVRFVFVCLGFVEYGFDWFVICVGCFVVGWVGWCFLVGC